jgi:hypothetical protein
MQESEREEGVQESFENRPEEQGLRIGLDPEKLTAKRFRKKRKRRRSAESALSEQLYYYTGAVGVFGFVLLGLFAGWLFALALTPLLPPIVHLLIYGGSVLYCVGSWWIVFIAYREDGWAGTLCLLTNLYVYVYVYSNVESTWKPAGLMLLGFLMVISGYASGFLLGAKF